MRPCRSAPPYRQHSTAVLFPIGAACSPVAGAAKSRRPCRSLASLGLPPPPAALSPFGASACSSLRWPPLQWRFAASAVGAAVVAPALGGLPSGRSSRLPTLRLLAPLCRPPVGSPGVGCGRSSAQGGLSRTRPQGPAPLRGSVPRPPCAFRKKLCILNLHYYPIPRPFPCKVKGGAG